VPKNSNTQITIGTELTVNRVGLGTNRIHNDERSKEALKKAIELGINFIDTAAAYANGESEEAIGETLAPYENIVVATKGGMVAPNFAIDASPETLAKQLEASLKKLKLKTIPLYFLHRIDPNVPLKESISFLKTMQDQGKIRYIGLSQVSIEQIEEARTYAEIVSVQNEYNFSARMYENVIDYCEKEHIVFVPFFPLHFDESQLQSLQKMQEKFHATQEQIALAWLLKRSPVMLPIPGSLSNSHLEENVAAAKIDLSDEDFKELSNM
jgi:pyridoxine 4-dehydrogenase